MIGLGIHRNGSARRNCKFLVSALESVAIQNRCDCFERLLHSCPSCAAYASRRGIIFDFRSRRVTLRSNADLNWEASRLRIDSIKTGLRFCLIFPEPRPLLDAAFEAAPESVARAFEPHCGAPLFADDRGALGAGDCRDNQPRFVTTKSRW